MKSVLRGTTLKDARQLAEQSLTMATAEEIEKFVHEHMTRVYPADLLDAAGDFLA